MAHLLLAALVSILVVVSKVEGQTCPDTTCFFDNVATIPPTDQLPNKYFVVGGLFDIHDRGDNPITCGNTMSAEGIISQLAFFWGINRYGENIRRNGVSVGAVAYDNCMRPEQTIENVLGFAQCKINIQGMKQENLVAYVGPYKSEDLSNSASLATEIGVTLVSPTADAADLSLSGNTLRLSPSFNYEVDAIVAFLKTLNSDFVVVLYSANDHFWNAAKMALMDKLHMQKICATYTANIDEYADKPKFVADYLEPVVRQKYIVPLMSRAKLNELLGAVSGNNIVQGKFRFILNSQIGVDRTLLTQNGLATRDAILLTRQAPNLLGTDIADFEAYIANGASNITDVSGRGNTWLADYKARYGVLPSVAAQRAGNPVRDVAIRTLLSVQVIIKGMERALEDCRISNPGSTYQFCNEYRNLNFNQNLRYIKFREFPYPNSIFDQTGGLLNSVIRYDYMHYVNQPNGTTVVKVGDYAYNGTAWVAIISDLSINAGNAFSPPSCIGVERCCRMPATTPATTLAPTQRTSEGSQQTTPGDYSEVRYRRGQAITGAYPVDNSQDDREEWGTRFDLGHRWIIALGVLAGLGILCVLIFEIYILYKLLGTRLGHKWRTMWLGQLLLFGILLAYLVLFAYLFVPTKATCGITRFGVGVSYAVCFAVLLVKLMVILTSKSSDVLLPGDESPNYLKGIYQFLMFIFAVGVQVVIDVQWLITVPPEAVRVTSNTGDHVWVCNHYTWEAGQGMDNMATMVRSNFENHVMSLIYIMVMILITTILSLNAHGIITNHRESVFIGIAAGFSIPIWLAWTLVGGLNGDHDYAQEFGDACIAFGLFLTVTLILFAMFLPKVRQLVNMGVEGIYLEDDRDTYYAGSVIMAPPSYKSKGPPSVIYVNNQGIYSEPVVISNGDPSKDDATHLKHPGSTYSAPPTYLKRPESNYGGSRVLRVTDDLKGRHPQKRPQSEVAYGTAGRPRSMKGTLPRSRSQDLGAL